MATMKQFNSFVCCTAIALLLQSSAVALSPQRGDHPVHLFAPRPFTSGAQNNGAEHSGFSLAGQSSTLLSDGRIVLIGGEEQNRPVSTIVLEDPSTGATQRLSAGLLKARYGHTATVLPNGMVLIFGGIGIDGKVETQAELLNPIDFSSHAILTPGLTPRASHTATLLSDGRVLIAGGVSNSNLLVPDLEVWDYQASAASSAGSLRFPRESHTAVLQADGSVLFSGGVDAENKPLANFEVFYPSNQSTQILLNMPASEDAVTAAVAASSPDDGAQDVSLTPLISVRFTKLLSVAAVNANTVTLRSADADVPVHVVAAEGGRLAFITPGATLQEGTSYTLTFSGALDFTGAPVPPLTIRFVTTGAPKQSDAVPAPAIPTQPDPFNSPARKLPPLQAPKGVTAVSGQVLQLNGEPLLNTTLQIGAIVAHTDGTGRFLLTNVPSGHQVMWIDGSTAQNRGLSYGIYEDGVDVVAKKTNVLDYTIWMTALDTADAVKIASPTDRETVVSTPLVPGLELHLPAGTVIRDRNDKAIDTVSITQIPVNQPPFPLPKGVNVPLYFTIQPGGAYLEGYVQSQGAQGARLFYPNSFHLPSGASFSFWNYDADAKGWYVYGEGFVTGDRKQVVPNPGVVIYEFTGAMVGTPPAPPTGPPPGPPPGCNKPGTGCAGDPVNLETGLFVYTKTDLEMPDVIPIQLTRTYRQMDYTSRAFGIGTSSNYDIYLIGDGQAYTYMDLVQEDGGRIHFDRVSPGTSWTDAVLENLTASTPFYGSQIVWNGNGWTLTLKNGTKLFFPESSGASTYSQSTLIGIVDRNGNSVTLSRDGNHNLTQVTSPNGRWIQYIYDTSNRVTQASDSAGRSVYYSYDAGGRLYTVKDANGGITTFGYDANSNMTTVKDAKNITYLTNHYDANNMVDKQTMADGSTYLFHYVLNTGGINSTYVVQGLTSSETDVTDPRGNIHKVFYNPDGFMSSEMYAFGKPEQQTITYNNQPGSGLLMSVTDPLNRQTSYTYDAMGNTTSVTALAGTPDAVSTTFTYEPQFNQISAITDPLGRTVSFNYDNAGSLVNVTNPDGISTAFSNNSSGEVTSVTDGTGNVTTLSYSGSDVSGFTDPLQRMVSIFTDEAGRVAGITNALGQTRQINFDSLNEISKVTDPLGGSTITAYDPNGNLTSITDAQNTQTPTIFVYENMDRLQSRTDQLGNGDSSIYDPNGNLVQYTDRRGKLTVFQYDALDRLTFKGFGTQSGPTYDSTINYTWDAGDRLTQITDSLAGITTLGYDGLDRLTSVTSPQGSIAYTYDTIGRRQTMTVAGQPQITYSYDAGSRVTQIAQGGTNVQFGYDALGRRSTLTLPNGIVANYSYDAASQLTSMVYTQGTTVIGDLEYTYDAAGHRFTVSGSLARTGLPQPLSGNIYNAANRLTQFGSFPLSYDLDGNLTSDGLHTYTWDSRNQLANIDSGGAAVYTYDSFGRRIGKGSSGSATTNFLYDGPNPVQELIGGSPTANLLGGGTDEYFTRADLSGSSNFLIDALGSTVALADATGTLQTQYTYEPFGSTTQSGASTTNSFAYTGREIDTAGIYYYRARYYSPGMGRFISEDPIGVAGGVNLYAYAGNDPLNYTDPAGTSNSFVHVYESYEGARAAGWSMVESVGLGLFVAAVDAEGTQGTSAIDANQHAMSGQLPDGTYQSQRQAYEGTSNFVRSMSGRKDGWWDHIKGLHAVQDSYSGSHDYQPWDGHAWNMAHQGPDSHWHQDAIDATRDYLSGAGANALNPNMPPKPYFGRRPYPFYF